MSGWRAADDRERHRPGDRNEGGQVNAPFRSPAECRSAVLLLLIDLLLDALETFFHRLQAAVHFRISVMFVLNIHQRGDGDATGE